MQYNRCHERRKSPCEDRNTRRQQHVTMEAETDLLQLHDKEYQGLPANQQKLGRSKDPPFPVSEGMWPSQHLNFTLLARTLREYISGFFKTT